MTNAFLHFQSKYAADVLVSHLLHQSPEDLAEVSPFLMLLAIYLPFLFAGPNPILKKIKPIKNATKNANMPKKPHTFNRLVVS